MFRLAVSLCLSLLLLVGGEPVFAMRCGSKLVREGDHQIKVNARCGKPAFVQERVVYREGIPRRSLENGGWKRQSLVQRELRWAYRSVVPVPLEVWVYNRGPRRLMQEILFEEGRVISVQSLGYGY